MLTKEQRDELSRKIDRETRRRLRILSPEVWLQDALERGPRLEGELVREARALGIPLDGLRRAKRRLGVEGGRDTPYWSLPAAQTIEDDGDFGEPAIGEVA